MNTVAPKDLLDHLGLDVPTRIALVGAGGKTTTMLALVRAGTVRGWRCAAATTTQVGTWQIAADVPFLSSGRRGDKLVGLTPDALDMVVAEGGFDLVAIEADGARGAVVKAPAPHEPVMPNDVDLVLGLIGADAIDRVIEDVAHRPMRVAACCGCSPYERLTISRAVRLLTSHVGTRKAVPDRARYVIAVTRVGPRQRSAAEALCVALARGGVESVMLGPP